MKQKVSNRHFDIFKISSTIFDLGSLISYSAMLSVYYIEKIRKETMTMPVGINLRSVHFSGKSALSPQIEEKIKSLGKGEYIVAGHNSEACFGDQIRTPDVVIPGMQGHLIIYRHVLGDGTYHLDGDISVNRIGNDNIVLKLKGQARTESLGYGSADLKYVEVLTLPGNIAIRPAL